MKELRSANIRYANVVHSTFVQNKLLGEHRVTKTLEFPSRQKPHDHRDGSKRNQRIWL